MKSRCEWHFYYEHCSGVDQVLKQCVCVREKERDKWIGVDDADRRRALLIALFMYSLSFCLTLHPSLSLHSLSLSNFIQKCLHSLFDYKVSILFNQKSCF